MAISLRGVARNYLNVTGDFSVKKKVLTGLMSPLPLHIRLNLLARKEHSFSMSECIFGWTAAFEQTWSEIVIRVRLNPDAGITATTMQNLQTIWHNGIVNTWSNRWGIGHAGEITCPLTFDVQWVTSNEHHNVRVRPGPDATVMDTWDTTDNGGTAAHEYGHMHGLVDEYVDSRCKSRSPTNTGTVMDINSNVVPQRMMNRLAANVGSDVVAI
jgi:hypothetical protein